MSERVQTRQPLTWESLRRSDGVTIIQARARNNSYYMIVPNEVEELRYASQSGNFLILEAHSVEEAMKAAEDHADRYDTRV